MDSGILLGTKTLVEVRRTHTPLHPGYGARIFRMSRLGVT